MVYLVILALCLMLVVATSLLHYEVLRLASALAPSLAIPPRTRALVTIAAAFAGHVLQIVLYAVVYWAASVRMGLGFLEGTLEGNFFDYLYFSGATFTTLGIGDIAMEGPIRLLVSVQSLNGLVLIGWSASFTYLSMERFWTDAG